MKSDYLTNPLQRELFSKVVDLLLDSPRRLNHIDAEVALTEAWRTTFHRGASPFQMESISELEKQHEVLSVGKDPHEALENWIKYDPWAKNEVHSYKMDKTARKDGTTWYLNYLAGADVLCAKGIYTTGGAVLTDWKSAGQTTLEYSKSKKVLSSGKTIHEALVHWAWATGWHKSLVLDELDIKTINENTWGVLFEVEHGKRVKYEAIVQRDDNHFLVLEVKEAL